MPQNGRWTASPWSSLGTVTGQGREVSTSLYETGLAWMTVPLAAYGASGEARKPQGSGTAEIVPYQAFETAGGWLMIAAGNDNLFRKLCKALELDELALHPDFASNSARVANRGVLVPRIAAVARRFSCDALGLLLDEAGVPNAPLLGVDQVASHSQTLALDMTVRCEENGLDLMGIPLSFDGKRPRERRPAPGLGQHNDILRDAAAKSR